MPAQSTSVHLLSHIKILTPPPPSSTLLPKPISRYAEGTILIFLELRRPAIALASPFFYGMQSPKADFCTGREVRLLSKDIQQQSLFIVHDKKISVDKRQIRLGGGGEARKVPQYGPPTISQSGPVTWNSFLRSHLCCSGMSLINGIQIKSLARTIMLQYFGLINQKYFLIQTTFTK